MLPIRLFITDSIIISLVHHHQPYANLNSSYNNNNNIYQQQSNDLINDTSSFNLYNSTTYGQQESNIHSHHLNHNNHINNHQNISPVGVGQSTTSLFQNMNNYLK